MMKVVFGTRPIGSTDSVIGAHSPFRSSLLIACRSHFSSTSECRIELAPGPRFRWALSIVFFNSSTEGERSGRYGLNL
jgi:hypothetical protein